MTPLSVKIGRFMCDSAVDDNRRMTQSSRPGRHMGGILGDVIPEISSFSRRDVIQGTSASTGDLHGLEKTTRKFSLPDFRYWDLGGNGGEAEMERAMGDGMETNGKDWVEDNNRTLLPHENNRMFHLFRTFHMNEDGKDDADNDDDEEKEVAADALPWRSNEQMDVLADSSKYLMRDDDELLATPRAENLTMGDDQGPRLNHHHHHHSSSTSSSGGTTGAGSLRPELSNCHSLLSLSHWLSEAESRHSEPFCPQHHHVLDAVSMAEPSSIRSSIDHRYNGRQVAEQQRDHSSTDGGAASSGDVVVIATVDDDLRLSRHEQVMLWLMSNDLEGEKEETAEGEGEREREKERHQTSSPSSSASSSSNEHLQGLQLIVSTH